MTEITTERLREIVEQSDCGCFYEYGEPCSGEECVTSLARLALRLTEERDDARETIKHWTADSEQRVSCLKAMHEVVAEAAKDLLAYLTYDSVHDQLTDRKLRLERNAAEDRARAALARAAPAPAPKPTPEPRPGAIWCPMCFGFLKDHPDGKRCAMGPSEDPAPAPKCATCKDWVDRQKVVGGQCIPDPCPDCDGGAK